MSEPTVHMYEGILLRFYNDCDPAQTEQNQTTQNNTKHHENKQHKSNREKMITHAGIYDCHLSGASRQLLAQNLRNTAARATMSATYSGGRHNTAKWVQPHSFWKWLSPTITQIDFECCQWFMISPKSPAETLFMPNSTNLDTRQYAKAGLR